MSSFEQDRVVDPDVNGIPETPEMAERSSAADISAIAVSTFGVGYLPIAPGTWGSIVGVAIYLGVYLLEFNLGIYLLHHGWKGPQILAWLYSANLVLFTIFCLAGIRAAGRAAKAFDQKDPSRVVVDEVMGQLIVFLFIPFTTTWWIIGAGFLLFRLFDIWKPYPIDYLQSLPGGIGICADDILAGIYAGVILSIIHAASLGF